MSFENYLTGCNNQLISILKNLSSTSTGTIWLWGESGVGKTHLLRATLKRLADKGIPSTYHACNKLSSSTPLDISSNIRLALDDVMFLSGNQSREKELMLLCSKAFAGECLLLFSARKSPAEAGFKLEDLSSRTKTFVVYPIMALSEPELIKVMQQWATHIGLEMDDNLGRFLIRRYPRNLHALAKVVQQLDHASLIHKRRLTVPLVKSVLDL